MPIDWLVLLASLTAGLVGGLHCAAMCGGIATGLSATAPGGGWAGALQLNLGRIGGYALAGLAVGALGHGLVWLLANPWLGIALRALAGAALVAVALRLLGVRVLPGFLSRPGTRAWAFLQPLQRRLLPADTLPRRLGIGALWGWLPCGLSFSLLTVAWLQAHPRNSALTMLAFGLGTLPVMLPLTWSGQRMGRWLQRPGLRTGAAMLVLALGLLAIAAPWLMRVPALHGVLAALGCRPLP
ncbi:sulfite exporter TauE/SafE family protein [Luteimonas kalidii]|uniref:Sulfite exporter TauE/SafE family protein n=1 Tax=Luteimonas kalidii TaxID=3042025 RepID=A0ABT6JTW0_9GAMM|nr:sulfite exporter TauE/SafE family protein [Luteimonas kalidii]MDH5834127.1 sulfite exporter TauE/SafE family protein [Luteimonas kalidii]